MKKSYSYTTNKVLGNIDAFIEGRPAESSDIQPYGSLVNVYPFTARKLKARVANKLVTIPLKIIKRAFGGYFFQQDRELMLTQQKLAAIEDKLDYLQDTINKLLVQDDSSKKGSK